MSENKIYNEDELWSQMNGETPKAESKPEPVAEVKPVKEPKAAAPKGRIDGFFLACMAGVAAVSVAATLVLSGMSGGAATGKPTGGASDLERENAELRAQLELQKTQIKNLQEDLMDLMGSEEFLATAPSDPEQSNEILDARLEAYDIFAQIQTAYADFDREKLEELIPEMDKRLNYLSTDALTSYYMILEYVEQPSNG